jgi:hypothetical protein
MPTAKVIKDRTSVIAIRLFDHTGQFEKVTEYHKADDAKVVVIPQDGAYVKVYRKGKEVGSYSQGAVLSFRFSTRPFRTRKVVFVRRLVRIGQAAKVAVKAS